MNQLIVELSDEECGRVSGGEGTGFMGSGTRQAEGVGYMGGGT